MALWAGEVRTVRSEWHAVGIDDPEDDDEKDEASDEESCERVLAER